MAVATINLTVNMTIMGDMNASIAVNEWVLIVSTCVLLSFDTVISFYTALALTQTRIDSALSKILMYNHNVFNGTFCIVVSYLLVSLNFTFPYGAPSGDPFVCRVVQSGFLVDLSSTAVICNVICQCADRFWASIYVKSYRSRTKLYIIACYVFIPAYSILVSGLRFFQTNMVNGLCAPLVESTMKHVLATMELILLYFLPVVIVIMMTIPVVWQLRQSIIGIGRNNNNNTSSSSRSASQQPNSIETALTNEDLKSAFMVAQRGVFLHALVVAIELTVLLFIIIILLALDKLQLIKYGAASPIRTYYYCFISLFSTFNSFVTILTVTALRRTVVRHWQNCKEKLVHSQTRCQCLHRESN
ncbi:unnamed protein product [Echinostoma caproni]|uniref:G_PROTEIN_RECEP_F1_2 domain-containing protein n=1 Tax=Echinostoma caproni TaxID=27848 RepID=A0A183ADN3_9TREM|nr:unnamed protein product [Echinostoma caproni]